MEIGHVLFIDIVGYSKLLIEEQKERLGQLTKIVLGTAQVRDSSDEQLVRLPTGDGMALIFVTARKSRRGARSRSPRHSGNIRKFRCGWAFKWAGERNDRRELGAPTLPGLGSTWRSG